MSVSTNRTDGYHDVARRIRDELAFHSGSECEAQLRDAWPLLWEALDELTGLVDRHGHREASAPRLFDPP